MLFGNSNLAWKLQLYYVALLVEFESPYLLHVIVVCLDSFYKHYFSLRWDFFSKPREPLSSTVNVSCGIKL